MPIRPRSVFRNRIPAVWRRWIKLFGWLLFCLVVWWILTLPNRLLSRPFANIDHGFDTRSDLLRRQSRYNSLAESLLGMQCPVRHVEPETPIVGEDHTIFISIVSYRDPLCAITIESIYMHAANPRQVYLGVVEQHLPGDRPCVALPLWMEASSKLESPKVDSAGALEVYLAHSNIKLMRMNPKLAKGPAHTRYLASLLYGQQSYFMMVDSHSYFVRDWDLKTLCMHVQAEESTEAPKGVVIGHHPPRWTRFVAPELAYRFDTLFPSSTDTVPPKDCMRYTCGADFNNPDYGYPIVGSADAKRTATPKLSPFIGAGFFFARGSMLAAVPFDPYLKQIFHGEEVLLSARLWTSGYDLYSPNVDVVFHYYQRLESPKYSNDSQVGNPGRQDGLPPNLDEYDASMRRIQFLLQTTNYVPQWNRGVNFQFERMVPDNATDVHQDEPQYGLGIERSLKSYWKYAAVDINERRWVGAKRWGCWYGPDENNHPKDFVC